MVTACTSLPYEGVWLGSLYNMNLYYRFTYDQFTEKIMTQSDIMVGGGEGDIIIEGGQFFLHYRKRYIFDYQINDGYWVDDDRTVNLKVVIHNDKMMFTPEKPAIEITLKRKNK